MIRVNNLTKTFMKNGRRIEVLRGINLAIERGQSLGILGASGAGKTTLLQIVGILDHPTAGTVSYDNAEVFAWSERKRAEFRNRKIGFVFQFHHLLPEFTAVENTMMPALISGLPRRQARRMAEAALTDVGLGDRLTHKPGELSGGEQQRVAVARAMIMKPEIILADEPTGNLDTDTGRKIEDLLIDFNTARGTVLVVVTHNVQLAGRMSRIIGLKDGIIHEM